MAPGMVCRSARSAFERRRTFARDALRGIEALAAIATVVILAVGLINHFTGQGDDAFPGEGKRVVAFRQVTNRICTEHRGDLRRALAAARSRVERIAFVARALGWDLNDLESVTPPPLKFDPFLAELAVRRKSRSEVLALQQAIELGDQSAEATTIASLEALDSESRELSREGGILRCAVLIPPLRMLIAA